MLQDALAIFLYITFRALPKFVSAHYHHLFVLLLLCLSGLFFYRESRPADYCYVEQYASKACLYAHLPGVLRTDRRINCHDEGVFGTTECLLDAELLKCPIK